MICRVCETRPATIHITEIKEGKKAVLDLCEECANQQGLSHGNPIPALLQSLVEGRATEPGSVTRCPECGISFEEFRAKGRLGCPKDYEVFAKDLGPLLEKIHGSRQHAGRMPRGAGPDTSREDRLLRLRRDLARAVKDEQYEEAARLRDEIRVAEEALRGPV